MPTHKLCILVADAARARLYTFDHSPEPGHELREWFDLVDPERRLRPSALNSDTPGVGHAAGGVGFGVGDHREQHTDEVDRKFAAKIAQHLAKVLAETGYHHAVIVASPHMLGLLRKIPLVPAGVEAVELARDLTRETTPQLHDHLAKLDLLPPRLRA